MEGTGKNLRLPANPPFFFEGQRSFDATTGPGSAAIGFADIAETPAAAPARSIASSRRICGRS